MTAAPHRFLSVLAWFPALLLLCRAAAAAPPDRPSILLITVDTIRADGLPFSGYDRNTAPFLTSLAEKSLVFDRAYSTSSWTVPAVTSLMTGLYPRTHGVIHGVLRNGKILEQEALPEEHPTLAEEMKKLGYRTYSVAANSHLSPELGYGRGFDRYLCVGLGDADSVNAVFRKWRTSILEGKDPVFVWLHYYDPHHPYEQNQPWFSEFVPGVTSADATLMRSAGGSPPMKPREEMRRKRFAELARGLYDSEIRRTDESIASLFKDLPFLNDYLVIVTGDHGEEFLDHGNVTHCQNLYEETLRVPLLWKWPGGGAAAGRTDALTSLVDIPSTLLTLAGGTPPATWSGISLFAAGARLPSVPPERAIVADLDRNPATGRMECLVTDQYKLIRQPNWKRIELYDLKMDPGERNDLSKTDKETAARLEAELKRFFGRLPAAPLRVARRPLSKEAEVELKGQGYIH